jgi:NAD(P)H-hydrate repair Nnr-like enzyme with NAD(P)H-hydrate epimerase domain
VDGFRDFFAEVGSSKRRADQLWRFVASHGNNGDDGYPATKFLLANQGDGVDDAANLVSQSEQRRVEVAQEFVDE